MFCKVFQDEGIKLNMERIYKDLEARGHSGQKNISVERTILP